MGATSTVGSRAELKKKQERKKKKKKKKKHEKKKKKREREREEERERERWQLRSTRHRNLSFLVHSWFHEPFRSCNVSQPF